MNQAAEQYHQRALAFQRANPGMVFVVRGDESSAQVRAWFTYFHTRGQTGTISLFRQLLNNKGVVQFPCEKPEHFDPSYEVPRHQWRAPEDAPQSRRDMSRVVERTMASLRAAKPKGRQPVPRDHLAEPVKSPHEWLEDYQANPPPVPVFSDEFRAKHGIPPAKECAA
jgi:hypothetical protein